MARKRIKVEREWTITWIKKDQACGLNCPGNSDSRTCSVFNKRRPPDPVLGSLCFYRRCPACLKATGDA